MSQPQVFLSYARQDEPQVRNLYRRLAGAGFRPWMDTEDLLAGQKWEAALEVAIESSDFFLACLSPNSVRKRGVLQAEVRSALDLARRRFAEDVYLIPLWIGPGEVPADRVRRELADYHWVSLSSPDGWGLLLRSMKQQLRRSGGALTRKRLPRRRSARVPPSPRRSSSTRWSRSWPTVTGPVPPSRSPSSTRT